MLGLVAWRSADRGYSIGMAFLRLSVMPYGLRRHCSSRLDMGTVAVFVLSEDRVCSLGDGMAAL